MKNERFFVNFQVCYPKVLQCQNVKIQLEIKRLHCFDFGSEHKLISLPMPLDLHSILHGKFWTKMKNERFFVNFQVCYPKVLQCQNVKIQLEIKRLHCFDFGSEHKLISLPMPFDLHSILHGKFWTKMKNERFFVNFQVCYPKVLQCQNVKIQLEIKRLHCFDFGSEHKLISLPMPLDLHSIFAWKILN